MAFGRVVLLWIQISLSLASRGDEPAEVVISQSENSKLWDAFSVTHDWLHVTGPAPMVTVMSQRGQLCTICIFCLATFAMLRQIYSAYQSLMQGIQQVSKIQEEAPVPMSPASFLAAANEEALRQQRSSAEFRRQMQDRQDRQGRPRASSAGAAGGKRQGARRSRSA
mmetsp:Transcript_20587/g.33904  ORF Transcript_20587/g.33904 Transcript_20587/m.33904 type:complete len:167 (-) Transcript_20587:40-540(-)